MTTAKPAVAERASQLRQNEAKWTRIMMDAGWTAIPSIILEHQKALGLDPLDLNILLQLAKHWWQANNPPHPSKRRIAEAIGIDPRTVQRRITRLENVGLIRREARRGKYGGTSTNAYHFDGLIAKATPYARKAIEQRKQQQPKRPAPVSPFRVVK
jgi:DNA-binding transcriptional regulator YhcF (GntR family)